MPNINYFKGINMYATFVANEAIFEAGSQGRLMYVIERGEVDLYYHGRLLETLRSGDIFGEMALIDEQPRSATAVARTTTQLIEVNHDRFLFLVQETPTFALQVMHTMAERLRKMNDMVAAEALPAVERTPEPESML